MLYESLQSLLRPVIVLARWEDQEILVPGLSTQTAQAGKQGNRGVRGVKRMGMPITASGERLCS